MENGNFDQGLILYLTYLKDHKKVSKSTLSAYKTDLKNFKLYLEKTYDLSLINDINQGIIMSYVLYLKNLGRASATISRSVSSIKNFMLFSFHEDLIDENLSDRKLDLPKERKKLPEILTVNEINKILSQPEKTVLGKRDKAMLEVLYSSGLKVNELIDLEVDDVDFKLKVITCNHKKKQRVLPLGSMAYEAVLEYINNSRNELIKEANPALFLSCNGEKMSRQGFWKIIKKYASQAKINKCISTSTFRHSFAAHMIGNGIHKEALTHALGNVSVASVQMYLDLNRKRSKAL